VKTILDKGDASFAIEFSGVTAQTDELDALDDANEFAAYDY